MTDTRAIAASRLLGSRFNPDLELEHFAFSTALYVAIFNNSDSGTLDLGQILSDAEKIHTHLKKKRT